MRVKSHSLRLGFHFFENFNLLYIQFTYFHFWDSLFVVQVGWAHLEYFIPCGDNPNLKDTSEKFLADVEIIEIDKNPKVQMRFYFE